MLEKCEREEPSRKGRGEGCAGQSGERKKVHMHYTTREPRHHHTGRGGVQGRAGVEDMMLVWRGLALGMPGA